MRKRPSFNGFTTNGTIKVLIPTETPLTQTGSHLAFRTHDGDVYVRTKETGVIIRANKKKKGKAARHADKIARRKRP